MSKRKLSWRLCFHDCISIFTCGLHRGGACFPSSFARGDKLAMVASLRSISKAGITFPVVRTGFRFFDQSLTFIYFEFEIEKYQIPDRKIRPVLDRKRKIFPVSGTFRPESSSLVGSWHDLLHLQTTEQQIKQQRYEADWGCSGRDTRVYGAPRTVYTIT